MRIDNASCTTVREPNRPRKNPGALRVCDYMRRQVAACAAIAVALSACQPVAAPGVPPAPASAAAAAGPFPPAAPDAAVTEPPAPPPAAAAAAEPEAAAPPAAAPDYAAHIAALRQRLPADTAFAIVVEPPFVVIGNEPQQRVAARAEQTVRWAVRHLKALYFDRDPDRILDVWLFADDRSYRRFARQLFGDTPSTPYGYYSAAHGALIMNIGTGGGTLVHEIVHPFVAANFPSCPAWLNEGLGSLYEQSAERDGRIVGLLNWRLDGLQQAIAEQRTPKLSRLVATTTAEFYGQGSGLHYAMARYLLYWLQEQGRLQQFYRAFHAGAADDPTGATFLRQALGVDDLDAFQPRFEAFVAKLRR